MCRRSRMRSDVGCLRFSDGWSLFWAHHRHSDNYYLINRLSRAPSVRQDRYREVGFSSRIRAGTEWQPVSFPKSPDTPASASSHFRWALFRSLSSRDTASSYPCMLMSSAPLLLIDCCCPPSSNVATVGGTSWRHRLVAVGRSQMTIGAPAGTSQWPTYWQVHNGHPGREERMGGRCKTDRYVQL
jgi:hypothetical protein